MVQRTLPQHEADLSKMLLSGPPRSRFNVWSALVLFQRSFQPIIRHCAIERFEQPSPVINFSHRRASLRRRKLSSKSCVIVITLVYAVLSSVETNICRISTNTWKRVLPRAQKEFRRHYLTKWSQMMEKSRNQPSFQVQGEFYSYIISLPRTRTRSQQTILSLQKQNALWRFYDGFDGLETLDPGLVNTYAGAKKQRRMYATSQVSHSELVQLKHDYDNSLKIPTRMKQSIHERLRFGCFMSHVLLWNHVLRMGLPFAVVFEDDAVVLPNFTSNLRSKLDRLPLEWDFLFLNGCFKKLGPVFRGGLHQSRGGLCTYAYVISAQGIRRLLRRAVLRSEKPIDHVIDEEVLSGRLLAFYSDPPLAHTSASMGSTLAY